MHFARALEHYREAVREDSALALAAVKGAAAANWPQVSTEDEDLIRLALQRGAFLPPRQLLFARGLRAYYAGAADSAIHWLGRAIQLDSTWSDAWMALGEVYFHLLPDAHPLDSLAQAAFEHAARADTTFTPPLLHLSEIALWRGDLEPAERLLVEVRRAEPGGAYTDQLTLMLQCARGPERVDWAAALRRNAQDVLAAGVLLAVGVSWPSCAAAAFRVVLPPIPTQPGERWAALQGLQNLLVATGRADRVPPLLGSPPAAGLPTHQLVLLDAVAGEELVQQADTVVERMGQDYVAMSAPWLWLLASLGGASGRGSPSRGDRVCLAGEARLLRVAPGLAAGCGRCGSPRTGEGGFRPGGAPAQSAASQCPARASRSGSRGNPWVSRAWSRRATARPARSMPRPTGSLRGSTHRSRW